MFRFSLIPSRALQIHSNSKGRYEASLDVMADYCWKLKKNNSFSGTVTRMALYVLLAVHCLAIISSPGYAYRDSEANMGCERSSVMRRTLLIWILHVMNMTDTGK